MVKILVISGSVGAGKSSVAAFMSEKFNEEGKLHTVVDMDYLRYAFPRPKDDPFHRKLAKKNLAAVAANYKEIGVERFIIPNVVENQEDVQDIHEAIPGSEVLVVRLRAKLDTLHSRLHDRESGNVLEWHLNRATELSDQLENSNIDELVIDTDEKSVEQVANELISKWNP